MADIGTQLESFPFDSSPDLTYDDNGDPRYDRAVGARVLRDTFAKFFSDGVFPNPGTALQISKGDGLKVNVGAGVCIIKGAMGGLYDDAVVTLDSAAPQGNVAYGLMLRYDNNRYDDGTGQAIYLRVAKGEAASDPQPPEPDRTTPGVYELRLGYVVVKNGSTTVAASDVHNEKGSAICPFAAPFESIDVSQVMADLRASGREEYDAFVAYIKQYRDLIDSAIDGTVAGDLQSQINALKLGLTDGQFLQVVHGENADSADLAKHSTAANIKALYDEMTDGQVLAKAEDMYESDLDLATSLAVMRFSVTLNAVKADQEMTNVYIYEFPADVDAGDTPYDAANKTYYVDGKA